MACLLLDGSNDSVLDAMHLLGSGRERSPIRVVTNGELLLEIDEVRPGRQRYEMELPASHLAAGSLRIAIEAGGAMAPAALASTPTGGV